LVISALFFHPGLVFFIPALFVVIPALSRDPLHDADLCKGLWCELDPGSSPGLTKASWIFQLHRAGSIVRLGGLEKTSLCGTSSRQQIVF